MNNNIKIAFLLYKLGMGGSERFSINLINSLLERDFTPIVILRSDDNPLIGNLDPRLKTIVLNQTGWNDKAFLKNLKDVFIEENISKVFCLGVSSLYLAKRACRSMANIEYFISLHSMKPISLKDYIRNFLYVRLLKKNDTVLFICNSQRAFFRKAYWLGKVNDCVIYNGIDIDKFSKGAFDKAGLKQKGVLKAELNIPENNRVILLLATIRIEKGHFYAIDALKVLQDKFKDNDTHLVFVGGGSLMYIEKLKSRIQELKLKDYIHFVGNQTEVRPYYNCADIFTLTSFGIETFSLAALEAMSFGLPCSLTNVGGASEMIIENKTGLLSEAKNPKSIAFTWNKMLRTHYDYAFISERVRSEFSLTKMVDNYIQVLKN